MRRPGRLFVLLLATLPVAGGCPSRPSGAPAPTPSARATAPLPEPTPESYQPPADGRLTEKQVSSTLKVWDRLSSAKGPGASPPGVTPTPRTVGRVEFEAVAPEVQAARELGINAEEYLWVKDRILEAEAALMTAKLNADFLALLEKTLADLKVRRAGAPDEPSRALIDEQIASFGAEAERVRREAREKEPEATRANIKLLDPYRDRLHSLQKELERAAPGLLPAANATPGIK